MMKIRQRCGESASKERTGALVRPRREMRGNIGTALLVLGAAFALVAGAGDASASSSLPPGIEEGRCLDCHDGRALRAQFPLSVHGRNGCTSCHEIRDLAAHIDGRTRSREVACGSCHGEIAGQFRQSYHALALNFRCVDCHRDIHTLPAARKDPKLAVQEQCTTCHAPETYVALGHGKALAAGNRDAATCSDCHGLHTIPFAPDDTAKSVAAKREISVEACRRCHADRAMMERNKLGLREALLYEETYHGKVNDIGYAGRIAGCADCHGGHNILPASDPRSSLAPANLAAACGKCHEGFQPRFVSYQAHPDQRDARRDPLLFGTFIFMDVLLISVFVFFWIHTFLWWRRSYWERCANRQADAVGHSLRPECTDERQIQRFSPLYRIMHILLIVSFFTLVMTGFPLKYHETAWAKVLMNFWGGVENAGLLHRSAALLLTALFLYTLWLSLAFLFPKGSKGKGWLGRLFGPDSLFFNLKDLQDLRSMFLWFFNRGEKPRFDRWTYWEKFDFFAVFWGMFAIGLTGFMLWFPEISSWVFPGWFINIATVMHSEEAFLAAIFIFTVHFFNNHFVPDKFPLEPNIFTGRDTLEKFREERPLEYERVLAAGGLDALKRRGPGVFIQLFAAAVGLGSLLLGLVLTVLIFWAAFFY